MKNTPRSIKLLTLAFITLIAIILVAGYTVTSFIMLVSLLYTSIVASKLYRGRLVSAIITSLNLLSVPTFVALLPSWEGASPYFKPVSYSILLGVLAYSFFLIVNSVSESYGEIMYPASKSMLLLLLGLNFWYLSNQIISQASVWGGIGYFFLFSFSGTAILSLFEALRRLPGRSTSLVASFLSRNFASRSAFLVLIFSYLFIVRAILFRIFPGAQGFLIVAEWVTLSVFVLRSYWHFKGFVENEYVEPDQAEDWSRHVQSVEWATDQRMEGVAASIQDFLDRGVKDSLIVCLVGLMRDAGELEDSISSSLSPLIKYEDQRPSIVFHSSQLGYIEEQNRKHRLTIFTEVLNQLSKIGLKIKLSKGKLPQKGKKGELKRT